MPVIDAGLAVAVAAAVAISILVSPERGTQRDVAAYAVGLTIAVLVLARRRWPLGVLVAKEATLPVLGDATRDVAMFAAVLLLGEAVRTRRALRAEQEKSERMLLNVLPAPIAARLKQADGVIADAHDEVTVLFADIVDFTSASEKIGPAQVVEALDELFSVFDQLARRQGLEKIKTIGDAYMVAGGLPDPHPDHARAVAEIALAMRDEVAKRADPSGRPLAVRIGIDTGPVVAGVIGRSKFIYDLWGDTVNTA